MELKIVISICGDLPYNISYANNSTTPIYWCEGGKDTYIDNNRKASYLFLKDTGTGLSLSKNYIKKNQRL